MECVSRIGVFHGSVHVVGFSSLLLESRAVACGAICASAAVFKSSLVGEEQTEIVHRVLCANSATFINTTTEVLVRATRQNVEREVAGAQKALADAQKALQAVLAAIEAWAYHICALSLYWKGCPWVPDHFSHRTVQ